MESQGIQTRDIIDWGFRLFTAILFGVGIPMFQTMVSSIDKLNHNIATLVERDAWQRRDIDRNEERIDRIEQEQKRQQRLFK